MFYFPKLVSTLVTTFVSEVDRCIAMKVFVCLMQLSVISSIDNEQIEISHFMRYVSSRLTYLQCLTSVLPEGLMV